MAEIRQEFKFEDKGMLEGMRAMRDLAVSIEKGFKEASEGSDKFSKEVQEDMTNSRKALDKVIDGLDKKAKATESDAKATAEWKKGLQDAANEVNILGVNVGDVIDKLKAKRAAILAATKATEGGSKAMRVFKVALASTGIGLLLTALGSLVAYFKSTQEGADRLQRIMKVVGSVFSNVTDIASDLGKRVFESITNPKKAIKDFGNLIKDQIVNRFWGAIEVVQGLGGVLSKFVQGDFAGMKEAANSAWDGLQKYITGVDEGIEKAIKGIAGFTKEMIEDGRAIDEITKKQQDLARAIALVETQREKDQARIEELNGIAQDALKTDQERAEAAQQAMSINQASQKTLISLKEQLLEQIRAENALSKSMDVDRQREYDLEAEIAQLKSGATTKQTELNNTLNSINQAGNTIREQELAQVQALKDAYFDLVGTIEDKLATQELDKLSGRERLKAEQDLALQEIDLLGQKAKAAGELALIQAKTDEDRRRIAAQLKQTEDNILQIRQNIIESYKEEARELANQEGVVIPLTPEVAGLGERGKASAERAGKELSESLAEGAKNSLEQNKDLFDEIRVTMMSWLGLDANEMAILEESAATVFNTLGQMYTESIDQQLNENQRLLDSLQERESIIQGQLEREIQLQEEGRANNVEGKRKELAAIRKEEEKAQKQAEKLRRRQQAAQLLANATQQASNLITGITNLILSGAKGGILGLGIAALAIPAMFSLFRQAKAQAQSAVGQRAFKGGPLEDYLGGKRRSGFVNRGGQSDIPGRGDGYRVQGTDLVIGGDEFLMNESESRRNDRFLSAMNKGAFRKVDLNSLVEHQAIPLSEMSKYNRLTSIRRAGIERSDRTRRDSILTDAIETHMGKINQNLKELITRTKHYIPLDVYSEGWAEIDGNRRKIIRK